MDQSVMIWIFALGFPVFFVAMWLLAMRVMAWLGWSKLQTAFQWDREVPAAARHFSWASMVIGRFPGGASYRNAMNVWIDQRGIYLRPIFLFKLFHPTLHFGWDAIASVEVRKILLLETGQIHFRRDLPMLSFRGRSARAVIEAWQAHGGGNSQS